MKPWPVEKEYHVMALLVRGASGFHSFCQLTKVPERVIAFENCEKTKIKNIPDTKAQVIFMNRCSAAFICTYLDPYFFPKAQHFFVNQAFPVMAAYHFANRWGYRQYFRDQTCHERLTQLTRGLLIPRQLANMWNHLGYGPSPAVHYISDSEYWRLYIDLVVLTERQTVLGTTG